MFLRLFTNQSSNLLNSYKKSEGVNEIRNQSLNTLLIILILSLTIINQQLTNSLLDIYFNVKSIPIFNTFDEVCKNQKVLVKTTLLNRLDQICNLEVRKRKNFEELSRWTQFLDDKILLDVINGNTVLISTSSLSQILRNINELKSHIIHPDDKKDSILSCYKIMKELPYHDKLYFL